MPIQPISPVRPRTSPFDRRNVRPTRGRPLVAAAALASVAAAIPAAATTPCGDLDECRVTIEINASDGDIGFHFLGDADDLRELTVEGPDNGQVFQARAKGDLNDQLFTETFVESSEPPCTPDPEGYVTLEEFIARWAPGVYTFRGKSSNGVYLIGETQLTHLLPAAPADVAFDPRHNTISWTPGSDLGECANASDIADLVDDGILPGFPAVVDFWDVVLAAEDGAGGVYTFAVRLPGGLFPLEVTVPDEFMDSVPFDAELKIEVGAIGGNDNATFTEEEIGDE